MTVEKHPLLNFNPKQSRNSIVANSNYYAFPLFAGGQTTYSVKLTHPHALCSLSGEEIIPRSHSEAEKLNTPKGVQPSIRLNPIWFQFSLSSIDEADKPQAVKEGHTLSSSLSSNLTSTPCRLL